MNWIYERERIYYRDKTGQVMAEALLKEKETGEIEIKRIYVDPSLRGQGIANQIMEVVTAYLRKNHKKAIPVCSYAQGWFEKNKEEYKDILYFL